MADNPTPPNIDQQQLSTKLAAELTAQTRSYLTELKEVLGIKSKLNEDERALVSLSRKLVDSAKENNTILRRSGELNSRVIKDRKILAEIDREIIGLLNTNKEFSAKIYEDAVKLQTVQEKLYKLDQDIASLVFEKSKASDQEKSNFDQLIQKKQELLRLGEDEMTALQATTNVESKKLALLLSGKKTAQDIQKVRKEELLFSAEVNKNMGLTGVLLDNLDKVGVRILGGIGLNFGVFKEAIEDGRDEMLKVAETYTLLNNVQKELNEKQAKLTNSIDDGSESYKKLKEEVQNLSDQHSSLGLVIAKSLNDERFLQREKEKNDLLTEQKSIQEKIQQLQQEGLKDTDQPLILANKELDSINEKIKKNTEGFNQLGKEVGDSNSNLSSFTIKLRAMQQALPGIKKAFLEAINDPLALGAIAVKGLTVLFQEMRKNFTALNKAGVEYQRITGTSATAIAGMNNRLASSIDVLSLMGGLTQEIGINAEAMFSTAELGSLAEAKNLLGLTEDQVIRLGVASKTSGLSAGAFQENFSKGAEQANRLGKTAVPVGLAFKDALNASKDIGLSLGNHPDKLAKAATAARALGLDLKKVDQIANSILDFESSIEAELEAQLLTGKAINLAKAREFALNNDLAGLSRELANNGASAAEFANMNRLQQESLAKALGMSREELAGMIISQDQHNNLTEEQRANIRGVTLEQSKAMDIQQRMEMSMAKLAQATLPLLDILIPVAEALVSALLPISKIIAGISNFVKESETAQAVVWALSYALGALGTVWVWGKMITGIQAMKASFIASTAAIKGTTIGLKLNTIASTTWTGVKKAGIGIMNLSILSWIKEKAAIAGSTLVRWANIAATTAWNAITNIGTGIRNLSILSWIKEKGVIVLNTIARVSSTVATTAWNAITNIGTGIRNLSILSWIKETGQIVASTAVKWGNIAATTAWNTVVGISNAIKSTSIARWITEKALIVASTVAKWLNVGATAAASTANVVMAKSQVAVAATAGPAAGGLAVLGTALGALGIAAAPAIPIILAIGAAILAASPAIYVLGKTIQVIAQTIGSVLIKALEMLPQIINSVADGFNKIFETLTLERLAGIFALGPALMSAAVGLTAFSAALTVGGLSTGITNFLTGGGILKQIDKLTGMAEPLASVGTSLQAIGAGLSTIADAIQKLEVEKLKELNQVIQTTALAAPMAVGIKAIGGVIESIGGKDSKEKTSTPSEDKLIVKIQELIDTVKQNKDVYMDSNKVSQALSLSYTKQ